MARARRRHDWERLRGRKTARMAALRHHAGSRRKRVRVSLPRTRLVLHESVVLVTYNESGWPS